MTPVGNSPSKNLTIPLDNSVKSSKETNTTVDQSVDSRLQEQQESVRTSPRSKDFASDAQASHKWLKEVILSQHPEIQPPCTPPAARRSSTCTANASLFHHSFPPFNKIEKDNAMPSYPARPYDATVKVILLGDYNVGKTSMLKSLSRAKDENGSGCCCEFRPGELVTTILKRDRKRSLIKIMDTGGQEKYRSMTASYYRGVHGCLLIFDVTREETFANIMNWHQDLNKYTGDQFVTSILVGTTSPFAPRAVTPERAFKMAESLGVMYLECDVEDDIMIINIMQRLLDIIIKAGLRKTSYSIEIKPQESQKSKKLKFCSC